MFGWVKKFLGFSDESTVVAERPKTPDPIVGKEFPTMVVAPTLTVDPREVLAADEEWVEPETWSQDSTGKLCRHKRKNVIQNTADDDDIEIISAPMEAVLEFPPIPFISNLPSSVSPEPDPIPDVPPPPDPSPSYDSSPSYSTPSYDSSPSYDSGSSYSSDSSSCSSCDGGGGD